MPLKIKIKQKYEWERMEKIIVMKVSGKSSISIQQKFFFHFLDSTCLFCVLWTLSHLFWSFLDLTLTNKYLISSTSMLNDILRVLRMQESPAIVCRVVNSFHFICMRSSRFGFLRLLITFFSSQKKNYTKKILASRFELERCLTSLFSQYTSTVSSFWNRWWTWWNPPVNIEWSMLTLSNIQYEIEFKFEQKKRESKSRESNHLFYYLTYFYLVIIFDFF